MIYWDHSFFVFWAAQLEPTQNKQLTFTSWLFTSRRWQRRCIEDNNVIISNSSSKCIREILMTLTTTKTMSKACRLQKKQQNPPNYIVGLFAHPSEKYLACSGIHVSFSSFDPFLSFRMYYPFFEMYTNFIETSNCVENWECSVTSFLIFCHRLRCER